MADEQEFLRGYVKGYREGLFEAWDELSKLTGKGYTQRELQIMLKSSRSVLQEKVDSKIVEIENTLGRKLFPDEKTIDAESATADLLPGTSICIQEERPDRGPETVADLVRSGVRLLSISRMHPDQLRKRYGFKGEMIWLTKSEWGVSSPEEEETRFVSPTNLPVLAEATQRFLAEGDGVIFLEGLEYLCTQNDFKSVLRFIQLINEQVLLKKGYLVLSITPATMDQREFSLIEREMTHVL